MMRCRGLIGVCGRWARMALATGLALWAVPDGPLGTRAVAAEATGATAAPITLSLPEARQMAEAALREGQPKLAYALTGGLLQANPDNGAAHFIRGVAQTQMNDLSGGRKSMAQAYRLADNDADRYRAADLAARLSFADERYTLSQLWLRRAVQHAPDAAARDSTVLSFRNVRARNPLHFNFSFSVTPSDNVNNGANSPYNVIDGVPVVGRLSPSAQAIDGLVTNVNLAGSYRIATGETSETRLTGRLYTRQVTFNDRVAGLSGSDISSVRAQAGISHYLGGGEGIWRFDANIGRTWYGGDLLYDYAGLGVARRQALSEVLRLSAGISVEEQESQSRLAADATLYQVYAGLTYTLPGGSEIGAHVQFADTDSNGTNRASEQWAGILSYDPAKRLGPAEVSFTLGVSTLDFARYRVIGPVAGGREDESVFGGITASFSDWSYLGFIPTLSVRGEKSRSNISRFDVDETSVSLGIRSQF